MKAIPGQPPPASAAAATTGEGPAGQVVERGEARARDLVCGMTVGDGAAMPRLTWRGRTYHFCSEGCRHAFGEHPERYVPAAVSATTGVSDGPGARRLELPVLPLNGLTARGAREQLGALSGVERVSAAAGEDRLSVVYDSEAVAVGDIVAAAEAAGVHSGIASERLRVEGTFCGACTLAIERSLEAVRGVVTATFNPATGEATVIYEPRQTQLERLERAVREAGYETLAARQRRPRARWSAGRRTASVSTAR